VKGRRSHIYWYCQVAGWSFYIIINSVFFGLNSDHRLNEYLVYFLMLPAGIIISHLHRLMVKRLGVMSFSIPSQVMYIMLSSFINGVIYFGFTLLLSQLLGIPLDTMNVVRVSESVINFAVIFCIWNFLYFGFKYFEGYKRSEIDALKYLAASRESEINNLKAQLNPHFIFNCLNSIRALIGEDAQKARTAVTRLSNILRTTLLMDKNREITLGEEFGLVRDFLNLEQVRYEERLVFSIEADEALSTCMVPPFIVQSQVENAIKHGISQSSAPGTISVKAVAEEDTCRITVSNTGSLNSHSPGTGVGFNNSRQRLSLLYGEKGQIQMGEHNGTVTVEIRVPLKLKAEKMHI
jgi:two-component system, LytTR family, sensor kinase